MYRSRTQLATAYAPGVLMTWEGGRGICRTVPLNPRESPEIPETTRQVIIEQLEDYVSNWFDRATRTLPDVERTLVLDSRFLDAASSSPRIVAGAFEIVSPDTMGYVPYPLVYTCGTFDTCGMVREYRNAEEQHRHPLSPRCGDHDAHWSQVDVVYVHWSGDMEPLSPFTIAEDANGEVVQIRHCQCGSTRFRLDGRAPNFMDWRYVCADCRREKQLYCADRHTLQTLIARRNRTGQDFERVAVNMMPVSYRANAAFYPHKASFIEFEDRDVVALMRGGGRDALAQRVARIHAIPLSEPAAAEIEAAVRAHPNPGASWEDWEDLDDLAGRQEARGSVAAAATRAQADEIRETWFRNGVVERGGLESPEILRGILDRGDWARTYDPLRLTIEHDALRREHLEASRGPVNAVDLTSPDRTLLEGADRADVTSRYQGVMTPILDALGIARLMLVRRLPVCEFSFGYTRVCPDPIYVRRHQGRSLDMPVRLRAFDPLPGEGRRAPIYLTRQENEALYVRLDEQRVRRWLEANGVAGLSSHGIGRTYLEQYEDFGRFLDDYRDREGSGPATRTVPPYVYMLLHSLSHQFMHTLADYSGIDRSAIGERIFPADLAFVVYRKGMTPDLGNISAMWRNSGPEFLRASIEPRRLRCGSGALCDERGGACPACIMIAGVSCIASNALLSRAALRGGRAPQWEPAGAGDLVGFFDPRLRYR